MIVRYTGRHTPDRTAFQESGCLSPLISRLILVVLVARAIAAPVALRPRLSDQMGHNGFELCFLDDEVDRSEPESLHPQLTPRSTEGGLVFRVCFWPAPKHRSTTSDRLRRSVKPRSTVCCSLPLHRPDEARSPASLP